MKYWKRRCQRGVAIVMAAAMGMVSQPIVRQDKEEAAQAAAATIQEVKPETCTTVSSVVDDVPEMIKEVPDGAASKYGLQEVKYVDEDGNTVDVEKLTGAEKAVYDGSLAARIREDNVSTTSSVRRKASAAREGSSYESPYVATEVRNQGAWGVCWSFGATAAIEANMVKKASTFTSATYTKDSIDLSERHMAWFAHNTFSTDKEDSSYGDGVKNATPKKAYVGGNREQVMAYLARSSGMEVESEAPYDITSNMQGLAEEQRYSSVAQLHDAHLMGEYKADEEHIDLVKAMVESYGAAMVSYYSSDGKYAVDTDGETNYYQSSDKDTNHAVCIVGWDDNYAASSFKETPSGDGAWLVRNSWGKDWGHNGCFWLSYYDISISAIASFDMTDASAYGNTYQYTGGAEIQWMSTGQNTASAANIYCAKGDEDLKAVGITTASPSIQVNVTVYVSDKPMSSPVDGTKAGDGFTIDSGMAGFHVIDLASPVHLKKGQYFSTIVRLSTKPGTTAYMVTESTATGAEQKGQTYYFLNNAWTDATSPSLKKFKNACIYAYTTGLSQDKATLEQIIKDAEGIKKDSLISDDNAIWDKLQSDIAYANKASDPASVKRAIRVLRKSMSQVASRKLYTTAQFSTGPGSMGVELYANGGTVKENGIKINYKTATLFHNIDTIDSMVWKDKKHTAIKYVKKGKYVVAVTTELKKPVLKQGGTLAEVDSQANEVVKATATKAKLTIKPLKEGDVYVWVLYYPMGDVDPEGELARQTDYAVTKVHVSTAPANVKLYRNEKDNPVEGDEPYSATTLPAGGISEVYVKGTIGKKTNKTNTLQLIENDMIRYNPVVQAKYADYVTVTPMQDGKNHFQIKVSEMISGIIKDGKTLPVTVSFVCNKSSKKTNLKIQVGNPVEAMALKAADEKEKERVAYASDNVLDVKLDSAANTTRTLLLSEELILGDDDRKCTDPVKFYKLKTADGFMFTEKGVVKVLEKPGADQNKISVAAVKGTNQYKITASKVPDGTVAYLMIYHNGAFRSIGRGYQIIRVTVGT